MDSRGKTSTVKMYFRDDKNDPGNKLRHAGSPLVPRVSGRLLLPCTQLIFDFGIYLWHMTEWDSSQWWRPTALQPLRMCIDKQIRSWGLGPQIQRSKGRPSPRPGRRWGRIPQYWGQNLLWRLPQPRHKPLRQECFQPPGRWGPWWLSSGRVWNLLDCPVWRFFSGSDIVQKSAPLCRESWWREQPRGRKERRGY